MLPFQTALWARPCPLRHEPRMKSNGRDIEEYESSETALAYALLAAYMLNMPGLL